MKHFITATLLIALFTASVLAADTNTIATVATNAAPDYDKVDITLSGSGTTIHGQSEFGLDVSASINPIAQASDLWFGVSQSLYWQPKFAGSTDVDADWSIHVYGQVYALPGWSVGGVYDGQGGNFVRTGPEIIGQYYMGDDVYAFGQVNYDFVTDNGERGWRYALGIGWEF
jgi:hypothetical protein